MPVSISSRRRRSARSTRAEQARFARVDGGDQSAQHLPHPLVLPLQLGGGPPGDAQLLRLTLDHGGQLLDLGNQSAGTATVAASAFKACKGIVEFVEQSIVTTTMMICRAPRGKEIPPSRSPPRGRISKLPDTVISSTRKAEHPPFEDNFEP